MAGGERQRVDGEPAFVLHTHPFRETSLIVEVLSRNHGRVPLAARGARRPRSALRGVLMAFQPLSVGWFGKGEVRTLAKAEWLGGQPLLQGEALLCGYYLNELLVRLVPRDDPHPGLFDAYADTLQRMAAGLAPAPLLRRFEKTLLQELGYGLTLDRCVDSGEAVRAEGDYVVVLERGVMPAQGQPEGQPRFSGKVLLAMAGDDFSSPEVLAQSKTLMRMLLNHYLGDQDLQSRRVFKELQGL